jgi:hypothetical protein
MLLTAACSQGSPASHAQQARGASSVSADQSGSCPVNQSQVENALQSNTQSPVSNVVSGNLCTFRTDGTDPYSLGVTIQEFPLPDQPVKTLDAAYAQLSEGSSDQLTKEPAWGDGAFLDAQSLPNLGVILYIGWIPGYEVQLNVPASDQARVSRADQITAELVADIQP